MSDQRYPRGTAYHEAGHAVVAWSFGLHVGAISVVAEDARGEARIGSAKHLSLVEQIALYSAGYVAENTFGHPAHRLAAASDHNRIRELLEANRVEEGPKAEALRSEAAGCRSRAPPRSQGKGHSIGRAARAGWLRRRR
jgi:ATP-dependent Zn protease